MAWRCEFAAADASFELSSYDSWRVLNPSKVAQKEYTFAPAKRQCQFLAFPKPIGLHIKTALTIRDVPAVSTKEVHINGGGWAEKCAHNLITFGHNLITFGHN